MRTLSAALQTALGLPNRYHHLRVLVEDPDGNLADVSDRLGLDWLWGVTLGGDIDQLARTLTLQLRRAFGIPSQNLSLAPLMEGSQVNRDTDDYYAPWVDVARDVEVHTAILAEPGEPEESDWELVYAGRIDKWDSARPTIELPARDGYGVLLDRQIETGRTYDEDAAEDTLQAILTDNLESPPTLYVPTSPGVTLSEFRRAADGSVGEALASIAETFGWYVRDRYDEGTDAYRTTLFDVDPDDLTPVWTFAAGTYFRLSKVELDVTDVRNKIAGSFVDPVSGNSVQVPTVSDPDSITDYGIRYAEINVDADSPIKSEAEMTTLLNAALAALKDPLASVEAECWWMPFVEEGDVVQFAADGENTDVDLVVAIKALRHEFTPGRERTFVTGRARPAGAYLRWRKLQRDRQDGGEGGGTGGELATIDAFSIAEIITAEGRYTQTSISLGAAAARWQLYERDGNWPTTDATEGGPLDDRFLVGTFDAVDVRPPRTVPASTTRYAIALALNTSGRIGDRASASTATGTGGPGSDPGALLSFTAQQMSDRVRLHMVVNQTIVDDGAGRYVVDLFRDSLILAVARDPEADSGTFDDTDAVPCAGQNDCQYFQFVYRARLRDTDLVHPTVEYTVAVGGLWASVSL
jgi:hypothetical protein